MGSPQQGFRRAERRQTLTDQIAAVLRERILSGDLSPGDRLPNELQLAQAFEVSRTVVREAIARLRVDGLIVTRHGLGTFVSGSRSTPRLDAEQLETSKRVSYVFELRWIMEAGIVGLAARRHTAEQLKKIEDAMATFERSIKTGQDGVDADIAFHRAIAEAAGNPLFLSLMEFTQTALQETLRVSHNSMLKVDDSLLRVQKEHEAIYRAIRDRDETAARHAASDHLLRAASRLSITFS